MIVIISLVFSSKLHTDAYRTTEPGKFVPTTWQIQFQLENIIKGANYTLQLALASATNSELEVQQFTFFMIDPFFLLYMSIMYNMF